MISDKCEEMIDELQDPGWQDHARTAAEVGECPLTGGLVYWFVTSHGVLMIFQSQFAVPVSLFVSNNIAEHIGCGVRDFAQQQANPSSDLKPWDHIPVDHYR